MSHRNARQKSESIIVPKSSGEHSPGGHGGRTYTREEPPQGRVDRDMDTLEGNIWGLLGPSQVLTRQERIATLARFFDTLVHQHLREFVQRRVGDGLEVHLQRPCHEEPYAEARTDL